MRVILSVRWRTGGSDTVARRLGWTPVRATTIEYQKGTNLMASPSRSAEAKSKRSSAGGDAQ
jgi:hypothetical protein